MGAGGPSASDFPGGGRPAFSPPPPPPCAWPLSLSPGGGRLCSSASPGKRAPAAGGSSQPGLRALVPSQVPDRPGAQQCTRGCRASKASWEPQPVTPAHAPNCPNANRWPRPSPHSSQNEMPGGRMAGQLSGQMALESGCGLHGPVAQWPEQLSEAGKAQVASRLPGGRPSPGLGAAAGTWKSPNLKPRHRARSLPAPTNPRNVRIRRGDPLAKTPKTKLKRGDRRSVAQKRKFRSVHGRRAGLNCSPGNTPFWLYISCSAS